MTGWARLTIIAVVGLAIMGVLTAALIALRDVLGSHGYDIPPLVFIIVFFLLVGGVYGLAASLVMREVKRNKGSNTVERTDT